MYVIFVNSQIIFIINIRADMCTIVLFHFLFFFQFFLYENIEFRFAFITFHCRHISQSVVYDVNYLLQLNQLYTNSRYQLRLLLLLMSLLILSSPMQLSAKFITQHVMKQKTWTSVQSKSTTYYLLSSFLVSGHKIINSPQYWFSSLHFFFLIVVGYFTTLKPLHNSI